MSDWQPPGKDCGACGAKSCSDFLVLRETGTKSDEDCPFYGSTHGNDCSPVHPPGRD